MEKSGNNVDPPIPNAKPTVMDAAFKLFMGLTPTASCEDFEISSAGSPSPSTRSGVSSPSGVGNDWEMKFLTAPDLGVLVVAEVGPLFECGCCANLVHATVIWFRLGAVQVFVTACDGERRALGKALHEARCFAT
jgi:hypothetical protein